MTDTTLHYENGEMEAGCLAITPLSSHLEGGGDFSISHQQPRGRLQGSHLLLAVPCSDTKARGEMELQGSHWWDPQNQSLWQIQ